MLHVVGAELRAAGLVVLLGLLDEFRQLLAAVVVLDRGGLAAERGDVGGAVGLRRRG